MHERNNKFIEQPVINVDKEIDYLNYKFTEATKRFKPINNKKGSELYNIQVDFCYLLNDIKFAPQYIVHKLISKIHNFINGIGNVKEN